MTGGARQVWVYGWPLRIITGALIAISSLGLPVILYLVVTWAEPPIPHARTFHQARLFLFGALLPYTIARVLRRFAAGSLRRDDETLVVTALGLRMEIPCTSIGGIVPWLVPFPGPGFWILLRSGQRVRYGIQPARLADAISEIGDATQQGRDSPVLAYALARQAVRWRWYHWLIRYVLFPLIPGILVFRLDQYLRFGGPFAEYYLYGLRPYLENLILHLAAAFMNCILWASIWRVLGEFAAFAVVWLSPRTARGVRVAVEIACSLLYYGGIMGIIVYAFLR